MFTALILTRLLLEFLQERGILTEMKMLRVVGKTSINFLNLGMRKTAAVLSVVMLIATFSYALFIRGNSNLGIDFTGGVVQMLSYNQDNKPDVEALKTALDELGLKDPVIQYQSSTVGGGGEASLKIITKGENTDLLPALQNSFPEAGFATLGNDYVGPSVGIAITKAALVSALIATFAILFYVAIRFEFSFAIAAVIALIHDVAITLGIFLLLGGQINAPIIAALLTIFGFSINDTIVIFDRIREDLQLGIKGEFVDLMNRAINQTLARTVITSGTTFLAAFSLWAFGGAVIRDFALTFLIGIVVGTYSSIYIASSSVLWITKGKRPVTDVPPTFDPEVTAAEEAS
jgi:SecD/SecF fusion protein